MSGEGGAGKVGLASGDGEGSGFEGAPHPVRPGFALGVGEAMPPGQGRFRLGFCYNEGRGIVRVLLAATSVLVAFILGCGFRRVDAHWFVEVHLLVPHNVVVAGFCRPQSHSQKVHQQSHQPLRMGPDSSSLLLL